MYSALTELRDVILESDISPFEMNHSGLIKALLNYLTTTDAPGSRYDRLKMFWKLFAESTVCIVLDIKNHQDLDHHLIMALFYSYKRITCQTIILGHLVL